MARRNEASAAWKNDHPGVFHRDVFLKEILPSLAEVTLTQMMKATGPSSGYCWKIKRGQRIPHPMHWEALRTFAKQGQRLL